MHIDIERLNEDPKVAKEFLEDELQKARQPQRVHYFITTADWMFWENKNRKGYAGNPVTSAQNVDRIHDSTETGGKVPEDAIEVFYPHSCGRWLKSMSYYKADDAERLFHLAYCISEDMTFEGEDKVIDAAIAELSQRRVSSDSDLCFSFTRTGKDGRENDFSFVLPLLMPKTDSKSISQLGSILGKCQTAFQKGYLEELMSNPMLCCSISQSTFHRRYCLRQFPWETEKDKKRDNCPWLQLPEDGRPFQEAWKEAGRRWFLYINEIYKDKDKRRRPRGKK